MISLFSGAGGLDLGAESLGGYLVRAAVEWNPDAAATLRANLALTRAEVIEDDIRVVSTRDILRAAGMSVTDQPDLLLGGPPCTPFSKSGFWLEHKRAGHDGNAWLLGEYTRVLREAQPRHFVLENVYALTYNNRASRPAYERLQQEITDAGYTYTAGVLNAADYGVPQLRPRLFLLGAINGEPTPQIPEPTHGGCWEHTHTGNRRGMPHITAGQALEGVCATPEPGEVVGGKYGHLLNDIPPGENYLYYTDRRGHPNPQFEWRKRFWSFLLKLHPDRPAPTIQAQPGPYVGPFHWNNRRLRVAELMRLFAFPDDYMFIGSRASIQAQIGNSVPPTLAAAVVRAFTPQPTATTPV